MKDSEPFTQGKYQKKFEKDFCEYINAPHAFAVNNATSALEMAAQLCQFEHGDEVIIPVCANCKNIRVYDESWEQIETFVSKYSQINLTHTICPECTEILYPGINNEE